MSQEWVFVLVGLAAFAGTIAWSRVLMRLNERGMRQREEAASASQGAGPPAGSKGAAATKEHPSGEHPPASGSTGTRSERAPASGGKGGSTSARQGNSRGTARRRKKRHH